MNCPVIESFGLTSMCIADIILNVNYFKLFNKEYVEWMKACIVQHVLWLYENFMSLRVKLFLHALRAIKQAQKFQKQIEISPIVGVRRSQHLPAEHDVNM